MADDPVSSPPPLTPPRTDSDRVAWLRLIRSRRVGPTTFHRLMAEHGSADAALAALPEVARAAGVEGYTPCPVEVARAEMSAARVAGARMLCHGGPGYPAALMEIADAPPVLWAIGNPALLSRPMVALVGARNASSLGLRMAKRLAAALAEAGFVVVSGLARGIDAAAHAAALDGGTVAVMAGGIDILYPEETAALAGEIGTRGCRLSEQPPGCQPLARHFPARNRIVSGLARATVVVEAAARSGSLLTARAALDQGREVLAVPGHPFDARAAGCNLLIRDGATLVSRPEDVIEVLAAGLPPVRAATPPAPLPDAAAEPPARPPRRAPSRSLREIAALHGAILARLGPSPLPEDQLIRDLARPAAEVTPELVTLELEGRVERHPGGMISRLN